MRPPVVLLASALQFPSGGYAPYGTAAPALWEPSAREYFAPLRAWDGEAGTAVFPYLSNVSWATFAELVRRGQPFGIADWGRGMPYVEEAWPIERFVREFPAADLSADLRRLTQRLTFSV